jgi:hypothetical protein
MAAQYGVDDFIAKPFESQQILDKVTRLYELGKSRVEPAFEQTFAPTQEIASDLSGQSPFTTSVHPHDDIWKEFTAPAAPPPFVPPVAVPAGQEDTSAPDGKEPEACFAACCPAWPGHCEISASVKGEPTASYWGTFPGQALTEEQIKTALTGLSHEVIERVVWEVVPDLAEALIKEAIRKIREGH